MTDFTDLPDLASERVGGVALSCNDEFFAERENLLRSHEAEWREHAYTDRGKWMDGWETRRRREPGYDWCVVRLGLPGVIRGVVVDTRWFRGNFPEACALEACELAGPFDLAELERADWVALVPKSPLQGDAKNPFAVDIARRFTHVRLNIFPDGGVARLRVHGEATPDWARLTALGGPVDLAALENGAHVIACSDMFFGSRHNLIRPGRSVNMSDGWETRRRRGPGHDWSIVRLARTGTIERVEIDTTHFRGNAPGRCTLEGCTGARDATPEGLLGWRMLLETPMQPHTRHFFDDALRRIGPVSHVRLSVFPDGGVARLRAWGDAGSEGVGRLDGVEPAAAVAAFRACCGSVRWAEEMAAARPFRFVPSLLSAGERLWWSLGPADWLEAFAAHPKIGEHGAPATGHARWSEAEQAGAEGASAQLRGRLGQQNQAYLARYGFIFIVCASGKSAADLLALLEARMDHDRDDEIRTAAEEQAKITRIRLCRWIQENP